MRPPVTRRGLFRGLYVPFFVLEILEKFAQLICAVDLLASLIMPSTRMAPSSPFPSSTSSLPSRLIASRASLSISSTSTYSRSSPSSLITSSFPFSSSSLCWSSCSSSMGRFPDSFARRASMASARSSRALQSKGRMLANGNSQSKARGRRTSLTRHFEWLGNQRPHWKASSRPQLTACCWSNSPTSVSRPHSARSWPSLRSSPPCGRAGDNAPCARPPAGEEP